MKALVTGATGFIGSHVTDLLIERGYDVNCLVRKTSDLRWLINKKVNLVDGSLGNPESLNNAVAGMDYIFHVAGLTFARNYEEFLKGNRDGTKNLLNATVKSAPNLKKFLYVSSQTAAGPSPSLDAPKKEDSECKPITSYGKSKYATEQEVLALKERLPFTIVRPPAVFGPRDTAILPIFKSVKMGLGTLIGFKPKYVSLIHSRDLSRGIVEAAESEKTTGKTYFVSSDEFYSWNQLMEIIKMALNKKFVLKLRLPHSLVLTAAGLSELAGKFSSKPPVFNYEKGIDFIQDYWICSTENARKDFGYRQQVPIGEGIEDTCRWYIDNGWM